MSKRLNGYKVTYRWNDNTVCGMPHIFPVETPGPGQLFTAFIQSHTAADVVTRFEVRAKQMGLRVELMDVVAEDAAW